MDRTIADFDQAVALAGQAVRIRSLGPQGRQMGLSYPTVLKAFHLIRKSILATTEDGELLLRGEVEAALVLKNLCIPVTNLL